MYTGLSNLGLSGYHSQYSELKEQAIAAARRNNASLWFAGAPADLTGFVWQDSAGTTPSSGTDPIGRLTDRAGSNAATQTTAGNRPTLELQSSGFYGMRFNGTNNTLIHSINSGSNPATKIVGFKSNITPAIGSYITPLSSGTAPMLLSSNAANRLCTYLNDFALSEPAVETLAGANNVYSMVIAAANNIAFFANGAARGVATNATTFAFNTGSAIGNDPSSGRFFTGLIYLACISSTAMPNADRIAIERFAALLSGATYA